MLTKFLLLKKHLYLLCLVLCASVSNAILCWAGTDTLQEKYEIQYVLPRDAIPAIKTPEFVPAEEAGLDDNEPVVDVNNNRYGTFRFRFRLRTNQSQY